MAEASNPSNRDDLDERIRRCIREELTINTGQQRNSNQALVARTRDLIRSSATFASRQLAAVPEVLSSSTPSASPAGRSSHPSHPLRLPKRKQNALTKNNIKKKKQAIPKTVFLLDKIYGGDEDDVDMADHEYAIKEDMILLKGEFDLECDADEASIRSELKKVFMKKFPLICKDNFDFVKRDRNTICTPVVKEGHVWDYAHVKHLCGAGKLYVRLNISKDDIMDDIGSDFEVEPLLIDLSTPSTIIPGQTPLSSSLRPQVTPPNTNLGDRERDTSSAKPSTSSVEQSIDLRIATLGTLFPTAKQSDVIDAVMNYDSLDSAAEHLSVLTSEDMGACNVNLTGADTLKTLALKMNPYSTAEKVKVDREDLVMDVFHHYKDPNFNPSVPIKFQIRGEPAVDAGGVLRQIYESVFLKIVKGEGCNGVQMFQGPFERVLPTYRSSTILSGTFEILGKVIAHSLVQGGPGFPYLCPTLYLSTMSRRKHKYHYMYVTQIRDATPSTLNSIMGEDDFLCLLENAGETRMLQEQNKLQIVQSLLIHEVILKHKIALDQMRKGLSILGLLAEIEKSPEKFQSFFVHEDGDIDGDFITSLLRLPDASSPSVQNVVQLLLLFIKNAKEGVLRQLLCFVTGCKSTTAALKPGCVSVCVEDIPDIFASTCVLELKLPLHFSSSTFEQFEACVNAVIDSDTFTTV
ncbi:uncharacterized protein LOC114535330 [Dendronephthya gigantea]|uniref:uncharacterized protein LOC114535330 n=1 Tax=Dendronephthya gigantea TaxID=151771 RepID=UPI00106B1CD6|nr:uncharacterized protein LOC114535330 [Dendronephthya gigantea]